MAKVDLKASNDNISLNLGDLFIITAAMRKLVAEDGWAENMTREQVTELDRLAHIVVKGADGVEAVFSKQGQAATVEGVYNAVKYLTELVVEEMVKQGLVQRE